MKKLLLFLPIYFIAFNCYSQSIDTSYGVQGKLLFDEIGVFNGFEVLPNGKLILSGKNPDGYGMIVRLNSDGSYDNSFGTGGKTLLNLLSSFNTLGQPHILSNGSIIIYDGIDQLIKVDSNGIIDNTFNNSQFGGGDFVILSNGKIVSIEMTQKKSLIRYNSDGSLDTLYGTNGIFTVFSQGQIIVNLETNPLTNDIFILDSGNSNSNYKVWKLENNNILNGTSFNQGAAIWATDFKFYNNALFLSGHSSPSMFSRLTKLNLDLSVSYVYPINRDNFIPRNNISFQSNGKILQLLRLFSDPYNTNIKINSFSNDGSAVNLATENFPEIEYFNDGIIAADNYLNKIYFISSGYNDLLITRFNQNNLSITEFNKSEFIVTPSPVESIASFTSEIKTGTIYTVDGKIVTQNINGKSIDLSYLKSGYYVLTGKDENGNTIRKKVLKK